MDAAITRRLATRIAGGDLVSGGRFGPEASVVAVLLCLAAAAALLVLARSKGRIVKPFWSRGHKTEVFRGD